MPDVYATWIEGSKESDLEAIRQAMESSLRARARIASPGDGAGGAGATSATACATTACATSAVARAPSSMPGETSALLGSHAAATAHQSPEFGTDLALEPRHTEVTRRMRWTLYGGKGGTRTLDPGIMSAVL